MTVTTLVAQCVMCFRTAAAQQSERAKVLNTGIVILLIPPMLVIGGLLFLAWWKGRAARINAVPNDEVLKCPPR